MFQDKLVLEYCWSRHTRQDNEDLLIQKQAYSLKLRIEGSLNKVIKTILTCALSRCQNSLLNNVTTLKK